MFCDSLQYYISILLSQRYWDALLVHRQAIEEGPLAYLDDMVVCVDACAERIHQSLRSMKATVMFERTAGKIIIILLATLTENADCAYLVEASLYNK